jgi:hypothetical protein
VLCDNLHAVLQVVIKETASSFVAKRDELAITWKKCLDLISGILAFAWKD